MAKETAISVRVTYEVKQAAEAAAADDSRTVASLMEKLLTEYLRREGYLPDQSRPRPRGGRSRT